MELHRTKEGFALYKEKTQIGFCTLTPAPKGPPSPPFASSPVAVQRVRFLFSKRNLAQLCRI